MAMLDIFRIFGFVLVLTLVSGCGANSAQPNKTANQFKPGSVAKPAITGARNYAIPWRNELHLLGFVEAPELKLMNGGGTISIPDKTKALLLGG